MAKKLKHFIITAEVLKQFEVEVDAISENNAEKIVMKSIKNNAIKPVDESIEVTDIYESEGDDED